MIDDVEAHSVDERPESILNVRGERVALGPLHRELLPLIGGWENDLRTVDLGGDDPGPRSAEAIAARWELLLRGDRNDWLGLAI